MKGGLCSRCDARLVDVAHDLPRQDVRAAAFWLRTVLPTFPPAVHLAVVDPGVGTDRAAIAVAAGDHVLVGPDNGLLLPAARELGEPTVWEIAVADPESETFHGRDVFAPAAADIHAASVADLERTTRTDSWVDLQFPDPTVETGRATGEVLVVDGFGNAITNIPGAVAADRRGESMRVNGERAPVVRTYAAVESGERLVTVGSHGNVELAVNQGRGADAFGVAADDAVTLTW